MVGKTLAAAIEEASFDDLDAPILHIGSRHAPIPHSLPLFAAVIPQVEDVARGTLRHGPVTVRLGLVGVGGMGASHPIQPRPRRTGQPSAAGSGRASWSTQTTAPQRIAVEETESPRVRVHYQPAWKPPRPPQSDPGHAEKWETAILLALAEPYVKRGHLPSKDQLIVHMA